MIIKLSKELYQKMEADAKDRAPKEACGLIGGLVDEEKIEVKSIYSLKNLDQAEDHFSMDPKEQFKVVKELRKKGQSLIGNYHSHPLTPARPSDEDKRLAYDEDLIYFILSLQNEANLKAFKIKDQTEVEEIEIIKED